MPHSRLRTGLIPQTKDSPGIARCFRLSRTFVTFPAMPSTTRTAPTLAAKASTADVIIVLGGGVQRNGALTIVSRARVERTLELYRAGVAPRLIMTGKCGFFLKKPISEAAAMAEFARQHSVPAKAILIEEHARDTLGNACFTREHFLAPNDWRRVHIVTSDFHARRAEALFRAALGTGYDCVVSTVTSGISSVEIALRVLEPIKPIRLALLQRAWAGALHARSSAPIVRNPISMKGAP